MKAACLCVLASVVAVAESLLGIPDFLELGSCSNVTLVENFDPVKYQGLWFDIASVPNEYQVAKECNSQNYTWAGEDMRVVSRGLSAEKQKVRQSMVMYVDEYDDPPNPAHMTVVADGMPESPYQVIATDYITFSCVYSCLEYFGFRAEFFWIFGRTPTVPDAARETCEKKLEDMGADYTKMISVVQGETCPYIGKLDAMLETNRRSLMENTGLEIPFYSLPPVKTSTTAVLEADEEGEEKDEVEEPEMESRNTIPVHSTGRSVSPADPSEERTAVSASGALSATSLAALFALTATLMPNLTD